MHINARTTTSIEIINFLADSIFSLPGVRLKKDPGLRSSGISHGKCIPLTYYSVSRQLQQGTIWFHVEILNSHCLIIIIIF